MRALLLGLLALLAAATPAHAGPLAAGAAMIGSAIAGAFTVASVTTFLVRTAISIGLSYAAGKLFGPKVPKGGAASAQERQAGILQLAVGEVPREVIFGEAATGGSLAAAFNYGGANGTDWVVRVILLADHKCESLQGFYVNDTLAPYAADGVHGGYGGQLEIHWRDGSAGQTFPAALLAAWRSSPLHAAQAPTMDAPYQGMCYVVVAYKADAPDAQNPTWSGSHPQFLFVVRGKRCYDPRKDSTVGGAGAHRWDDPATWEYTRNPAICRYNWMRGIYALDQVDDPAQLLVGRGLSPLEAPPQRVFAYANLCDEPVDDGFGGVAFRYSIDGVIRSTDDYLSVEHLFEAAMGGRLIQPDGGVEVEPGQAKTPVFDITDDDLVVGRQIAVSQFGSDAQRINTVIPRYIEPAQKYQDHAGQVLRDLADIAADGGPREETLSLSLVTQAGQAQRLGEMRRRSARLERTATVSVGPRFAEAEAGDWIRWTSARYFGGAAVVFRIVSQSSDQGWVNDWVLEETSFDVYGFGGAPLDPVAGQEPTPVPGTLALVDVTAAAIQVEGDSGSLVPAIRFGWDTPVDPAIARIRAEVRVLGQTQVAPTAMDAVNAGALDVTNGVFPNMTMQARLVPLGAPGRPIAPSAWFTVSTGQLVSDNTLGFAGVSPEAITSAVAAAETLANALSKNALQQTKVNDALRVLGLTPSGLPIGPFAVEQKIRTDFVVQDVSLIGVRNGDGTAFDLSSTTLRIDGDLVAERFDVLFAGVSNAFAQLATEATLRANADFANASSISSLSATVGGHTASLTTISTAISELNGRTEASFELIAAAGAVPAYAKLVATNTGSGIALAAQELALFNFVSGALVRVLRLVDGKAFFGGPVSIDFNLARLTLGPGFGAANDLLFWFGPSSVAVESMTKTNGSWAFATDRKAYYGTGELSSGGGITLSVSPTVASWSGFGTGPQTTSTVVVTPSGGSPPYTFAVAFANGDPGVSINGSTGSGSSHGASFTANVTAGASIASRFSFLVVDSAGKSAVGIVNVNFTNIL